MNGCEILFFRFLKRWIYITDAKLSVNPGHKKAQIIEQIHSNSFIAEIRVAHDVQIGQDFVYLRACLVENVLLQSLGKEAQN